MLSKNEMIEQMLLSDKYIYVVKKIPEQFREELVQHCLMIILLKPELEIKLLYLKGKLVAFFARIAYTELFNTYSPFNKEQQTEHYLTARKRYKVNEIPEHVTADPYAMDELENDVNNAFSNLSMYHKVIMKAYADCGTYRAAGDKLGIAWKSVYNAVQNARKEIKENI